MGFFSEKFTNVFSLFQHLVQQTDLNFSFLEKFTSQYLVINSE